MRQAATVLLGALSIAGCSIGPHVSRFDPARRPEGVSVTLQARGREVTGELLQVDESGLLLLERRGTPRIVAVSFAAIERATFSQLGSELHNGQAPKVDERERLRRVSRFPQGLTPELLEKLLAAHGQAAPERIGQ